MKKVKKNIVKHCDKITIITLAAESTLESATISTGTNNVKKNIEKQKHFFITNKQKYFNTSDITLSTNKITKKLFTTRRKWRSFKYSSFP